MKANAARRGRIRFTDLHRPGRTDPTSAVATDTQIGPGQINQAFEDLAGAIADRHAGAASLWLVGIAQGGIPVARRLAALLEKRLGRTVAQGAIDVSFHRDDIGQNPIPREYPPTAIPGDISGATVVLVDDVLFSGRTVKAALDELFDHGRPDRVELAVLVDRGHRRLPFSADYCGFRTDTEPRQRVQVTLDDSDPSQDSIQIESPPS